MLDGRTGVLVEAQDPHLFAEGVVRAIGMDLAGAWRHIDQFSIVPSSRPHFDTG